MDLKVSPALVPALCALAGTFLAARLPHQPLWALALLTALAMTLGRWPWARALAALVLGLLNTEVRQAEEPLDSWLQPKKPVEVVGRVTSHPSAKFDRTLLRLRTTVLRQGAEIKTDAYDLWVSLPGDDPPPVFGTRLRLRGYLRQSSFYANGLDEVPRTWRLRVSSARFVRVEAPPSVYWTHIATLRKAAFDLTASHRRQTDGTALVEALLLGDRTALPERWLQALRRSGLAHLLAVSGLHVGVVALAAMWALILVPPRWRLGLAAVVVVVYMAMIGLRPSVLRACLMALGAICAVLCGRPPQGLNALGCVVLCFLVWTPDVFADIGCQLSLAATAGILLWTPRLSRMGSRIPAGLRQPLAVTIAAQVATLPWTLTLAGGFHPLAIVLNLIFVPWLALAVVACGVWILVAGLFEDSAVWLLPGLEALTTPVELLASLPASHGFLVPVTGGRAWGWPLTLTFALWLWRPRLVRWLGLILWMMTASGGGVGHRSPSVAELAMIDVGQGDAILLRDRRHAVLVDGGGWPSGDLGGRVLVPALSALGVRALDAVVLTHPDVDHCGGLVDVTRYLRVAEIWTSPGWSRQACAGELLATPGARWRVMWRGRSARIGLWQLTALHPRPAEEPSVRLARDDNDRSLVLSAEALGHRVLLTGDIEIEAERELLSSGRGEREALRADVLKVAHHGSRTSTAQEFLAAVAPHLALISAGRRNPYGHPTDEVITTLRQAGVRVLRTDRSGMVRLRFLADGRSVIDLPGAEGAEAAWAHTSHRSP